VEKAGFVQHPTIEWLGASPDGFVGDDGLVEIKCPLTATHVDYLLWNEVPREYRPQMTMQLACTRRKWCDFVSYDPKLPFDMRLFVTRFAPDEKAISDAEVDARNFLAEVEAMLDKLRKRSAGVVERVWT
jgi:hypothetical protein